MGVRLALGATRGGVAMLVLRDCLALVGLGLAIGVPLSLAATRPLSSQLYGLQADDPQTIASVTALLVAAALIAAGRPAQSAARVDPVVLLRAD
jgi:ABC-type antimicrobial peptide transport system permease subunit